jgi:hypothetical protein
VRGAGKHSQIAEASRRHQSPSDPMPALARAARALVTIWGCPICDSPLPVSREQAVIEGWPHPPAWPVMRNDDSLSVRSAGDWGMPGL